MAKILYEVVKEIVDDVISHCESSDPYCSVDFCGDERDKHKFVAEASVKIINWMEGKK